MTFDLRWHLIWVFVRSLAAKDLVEAYILATHHLKRLSKLQSRIRREKLAALLVTDEHNVTYLTGFSGDSTYLLLTPSECVLLSDTRYSIQLEEECPEFKVQIRDAGSTKFENVLSALKSFKVSQLGLEADALTKAEYDQFESALTGIELAATTGWTAKLRAIKDKVEIETIRKSIAINERAFRVIREQLSAGQTELQVAHNLEHQIRAFGGSRCAFDPIVGVGPRAALPHGTPSSAQIGESFMVLIDWGTQYELYASDLTRVLVTGKVPAKFRKVYDAVLSAQLSAIEKVKPGVTFQEVDSVARKLIADAGFGKYFGHGLGHGFGLQIHETPFLSPIHEGKLEPGMVITVEPGIYLPGWAGVRIEDNILVTKDGHEVLSSLPKELDQMVVSLL